MVKKFDPFLLFLIVANAFVALLLWLNNTPIPFLTNWDIYEHQTLVNNLLLGRINFFTSNITDTFTFNGYPPTFHLFIAIFQKILFIDSLNSAYFWYFAQIIYFFVTVVVQYIFTYKFTRSTWISATSALFSIYIFESFGSYSSFFLLPQTTTGILGAILISSVYKRLEHNKKVIDLKTILLFVSVFLMHYIIGSLSIVMTITLILIYKNKNIFKQYLNKYRNKHVDTLNVATLVVLFVFLVIILFNKQLVFNPLQSLGATGAESVELNLTLNEKMFHIKNWYGNFLFILVPIGLMYGMARKSNHKIINIFTLAFLAMFFFPFPYTSKFFVLGRFFISTTLALGVFFVISRFKNYLTRLSMLTALAVALCIVFLVNISWYKKTNNMYEGYVTQFSINELIASDFLNKNYTLAKDTILVSDPATQYVLEAFSGINTQGGAYATQATRKLLIEINNEDNPETIARKLYEIRDSLEKNEPNKILLVLSGRYFAWQNFTDKDKLSITKNIYSPLKLTKEDHLEINEIVKNSKLFKRVYSNEDLIIFEVSKN